MTWSERLVSAIDDVRYELEFCGKNHILKVDKQFTLDLLLAEQKRMSGCDVCRGVKILHGTFSGTIPVDSDTQIEVDSDGDIDFDFCPVCGRNMTEATGNKTERPIG